MSAWLRIVGICGALLGSQIACGRDDARPSSPAPQNPSALSQEYTPVYGVRDDKAREPRGTIRGDFQWAAASPSLTEAASRWEQFLKAHDPPSHEYEDNMHASYVAAAKYELIRVYYLEGRREDGDALLRREDPVGWMK